MGLGCIVPGSIADEVGATVNTRGHASERLWNQQQEQFGNYSAQIYEEAVSSATTQRRQARLAGEKRLVRSGPLH